MYGRNPRRSTDVQQRERIAMLSTVPEGEQIEGSLFKTSLHRKTS